MVFKSAIHDILLVFKFHSLTACRVSIRCDAPLDIELDISDHLLTFRVVYTDLEHSFRVLAGAWRHKLSLHFTLPFPEEAHRPGHFALLCHRDRVEKGRVHLSHEKMPCCLDNLLLFLWTSEADEHGGQRVLDGQEAH